MENKYEVVIKYIEKLISQNKLKQGQRLPSIRVLAIELKCSKSTIIRAYEELELNHKIYSIPKSGYYLVERKSEHNNEQGEIDFSETLPDSRLLPYKEFNHCINKAIDLHKDNLFSYSTPEGLSSLRNVLVKHFEEYQIFTSADKIFITSGAQQALSILSNMKFPNGKTNILLEQPTYGLMHKISEINGSKLLGITRNYNGIDIKELERIFKEENIKIFYTMPRFQNPLGTCYSEKDKIKITELAEKYDVYIVEDDYLVDLNEDKKILPMFYYDIYNRVIYVKSFSKTFMPGIRIGAVVLHEPIKREFLKYKNFYDINTSILSQGGLEIYINSGMYKNHIRKIQQQYRKKMDIVRECMKHINSCGVEYFIPETGFFIWMKLPIQINRKVLLKKLEEKKIYISSAERFFMEGNVKDNGFRICIAKLTEQEIKRGLQLIFQEICKISKACS